MQVGSVASNAHLPSRAYSQHSSPLEASAWQSRLRAQRFEQQPLMAAGQICDVGVRVAVCILGKVVEDGNYQWRCGLGGRIPKCCFESNAAVFISHARNAINPECRASIHHALQRSTCPIINPCLVNARLHAGLVAFVDIIAVLSKEISIPSPHVLEEYKHAAPDAGDHVGLSCRAPARRRVRPQSFCVASFYFDTKSI